MGIESSNNTTALKDPEMEYFETEIKEIYERDYLGALPEILNRRFTKENGEPLFSSGNEHFDTLQDLIDYIAGNPELSQEEIVKTLIENMHDMPDGQTMSVRHAAETGEMFCSISAATFQLIMEKIELQLGVRWIGVKCEYANPVDHAANIVRIGDKVFYADPRNGIFDDITANLVEEERGGLKIYRAKSGGIFSDKVLFSIIPSMTDSSKAMVHADMGNFESLVDYARGNFGEERQRMGEKIAKELQEYAQKYLGKLGVLGDKEKEDAFAEKYKKLDEISGKELNEFKKTEEFKAEERRVSVDTVLSGEWRKIPDEIKRELLANDRLQTFILSGDKDRISEIVNDPEIQRSLGAIQEAFGMRWLISDISTDKEKMADLKPYIERANKELNW